MSYKPDADQRIWEHHRREGIALACWKCQQPGGTLVKIGDYYQHQKSCKAYAPPKTGWRALMEKIRGGILRGR